VDGLPSSDYISVSTYVRVLEKKLLSALDLDRAADSHSVAEALRLLSQNSDYSFGSLARPEDYEGQLKAELERVYGLMYGASPSYLPVDILACKYDFHNLKAAIKDKLHKGRTPPPYIRVTRTDPALIESAVTGVRLSPLKSDLPEHLVLAIDEAELAFAKEQNPQSIDYALDKAMFRHMLCLCEGLGNGLITAHVRAQIDFLNLKTLLRAKNMKKSSAFLSECLVPGGEVDVDFFTANFSKNPAALAAAGFAKSFGGALKKGVEAFERSSNYSQLERLLDSLLVEETRKAKYVTYGPEIVYAYLFSKENEVRQIRIIVTGKLNAVRAELLKERLRLSYV
jgi:V/A-type H+-transporting ATPase subunit C